MVTSAACSHALFPMGMRSPTFSGSTFYHVDGRVQELLHMRARDSIQVINQCGNPFRLSSPLCALRVLTFAFLRVLAHHTRDEAQRSSTPHLVLRYPLRSACKDSLRTCCCSRTGLFANFILVNSFPRQSEIVHSLCSSTAGRSSPQRQIIVTAYLLHLLPMWTMP